MHSHHMHNEHKTVENVIARLQAGENIALISDAGTPAISDPGFLLTRACIEKGIEVECLPGATAFVPALVNSGLPNDKFIFEGFLPDKKGRQTRFLALAEETRTMILYVSPHKLVKTLAEFATYFGEDRPVSVSRELSKLHEENVRGTVKEVLTHFEKSAPRGEIVVVVGGKPVVIKREVLDWYHLKENLYKVGGSLKRLEWVEYLLWHGGVDVAIAELDCLQNKRARNFQSYLNKHRQRIPCYRKYQQLGIPIGSGDVESKIKQVGTRVKLAGARWNRDNAPRILRLRCAYLNRSPLLSIYAHS
jgi:16S rRNA (cytidine1402-2'-O)-methyltransferase